MELQIPYEVIPRRDTGVNNAKLGIWLFLASEVMFFTGLIVAYLVIRINSPSWPNIPDILNSSVR